MPVDPVALIDPAVELAGRLAQLLAGQKLAGQVVGKDGDGHRLLKTLVGTFAVDPTDALPETGDVDLIITRADRQTGAVIIARGGKPVDQPVPVRLTLVALDLPVADGDLGPPAASRSLADSLAQAIRSMPAAVRAVLSASGASLAPADAAALLAEQPAAAGRAPPAAPRPPVAGPAGPMPAAEAEAAALWQASARLMLVPQPAAARLDTAKPMAQSPLPVMVLAVAPAGTLTPVVSPAPGSPMAILATSGRVSHWTVEASEPLHARQTPVTLINSASGQRAQILAPAPLLPGTTVALMTLSPAPARPVAAQPPAALPAAPAVPATPAAAAPLPTLAPALTPFEPMAFNERAIAAVLDAGRAAALAPPPPATPLTGDARGVMKFLSQALGLGGEAAVAEPSGGEGQPLPVAKAAAEALASRAAAAPPPQVELPADIRSTTLMLRVDGQPPLPAILLFEQPGRQSPSSEKAGGGEEGSGEQRFSVVVDYPRLGRLRLDGRITGPLVQLVVRTAMAVPESLVDSAQTVFRDTLSQAGLAGTLHFGH